MLDSLIAPPTKAEVMVLRETDKINKQLETPKKRRKKVDVTKMSPAEWAEHERKKDAKKGKK